MGKPHTIGWQPKVFLHWQRYARRLLISKPTLLKPLHSPNNRVAQAARYLHSSKQQRPHTPLKTLLLGIGYWLAQSATIPHCSINCCLHFCSRSNAVNRFFCVFVPTQCHFLVALCSARQQHMRVVQYATTGNLNGIR